MKFGKIQRNFISNKPALLKLYFLIGSLLILLFFIIYTNYLLNKTRKEARIVPNLFARFMTFSGSQDFDQKLAQYIFEEVIIQIEYPIIVTDADNEPLYWKNIGIDENTRFDELSPQKKNKIRDKVALMKKNNITIELTYNSDNNNVLGYVYYKESASLRQLQYLPYIEMFMIIAFFVIGFFGIILIKKDEKNHLWIGLAKETAHQFGTPITSLLGWIELLKMEYQNKGNKKKLDTLEHMRVDVEQLQRIAYRFGKVGSSISLKPEPILNVVSDTVDYFSKRLPKRENAIKIHLISNIDDEKKVEIDKELVKWTLENVIKNCIDAMQLKGGNIFVTVTSDNSHVSIILKDEGKGMNSSMFHKIFEPGVTSKKRGWGLGLSLAKRIVEDFHNGRIKVLESTLGEGTTFEILLPEKQK